MAYSHFNVISLTRWIQQAGPGVFRIPPWKNPMDAASIQAMIENGLPGAQ
jgi:hypothetical protein